MTADIHSLIGAYALDAVDDLERAAVDRHLRECDDCRVEAAELREAAARLADGAWSVPPPRMRDNVLAVVATTRQVPVETPRRPRRAYRTRWVAAAAAVLAAAGAGTAVFAFQEHRVRDEHTAAEAARDREAEVRTILAAPDVVLRVQPLSSGGKVTVAYSRLRDSAVILMAADAPPADGRVFQLWTVRGGKAVSEDVLAAGQTTAVKILYGVQPVSVVGVSVEPPGGSPAPTDMVAGVKTI
ncbi:anti-sigma factor [Actinoplanes oblitus]|uniref:Regulator of SigK n=1 Tax=Actinoplanes oblitus TaxID=3040509 RepID=A0ABY8WQD3_9ACTN|nr:anti-sigma factor [Actinoplanes oblitus]WIM99667.1 anti-sigma factor [Actinoplanes oblitus]